MSAIFMEILNTSVMASIVACAVMLVRLLLKKAPRMFSYALWAIVLFKLLCPFKLESALSVLPSSANTVPQSMIYTQVTATPVNTMPVADNANNMLNVVIPPMEPVVNADPVDIVLSIASWVWFTGVIILLVYAVFSYLRLKLRLRTSVLVRKNIWETDIISTPFVLGFIKPKIYLPVDLDETDYILEHEQTHIKRFDYLVKPIAFFALCLHWFNPVIWLSYFLFCKDMEMSCDESVLKRSDHDIRVRYSGSLLALSSKQSGLISPLAFGESNTKSRIKNTLRYKKPSLWISIAAVAAVVAVTVGFAATRTQETQPWEGVPQRNNWREESMHFNRITFGSERDYIAARMGDGPESEIYTDTPEVHYYIPPVIFNSETGEESEVPDSDYDIMFYFDNPSIIEKKGLHGIWRIDLIGNGEMAGVSGDDAGTLAGVLREYGGPNEVERNGNIYTLWYFSPDDSDKRMWFEVENGELNRRMGIVCVCEGDGISANQAVQQLVGSIVYTDGQISFQIPPQFYMPSDWNIHIAGRAESDGMSMSVHEFDDVNDNRAWEAGKRYSIPIEGRNLTELTMDIFLPGENGGTAEGIVDLLANIQSFEPVPVQEATANYDNVKITMLSDMPWFSGTTEFETDNNLIVSSIENELAGSTIYTDKPVDLEANIINKYQIELYNSVSGYSAALYYDTLYDAAYVVKDGGMYTISTDFARYINSLFENTGMSTNVKEDAAKLFKEYGWTLDYEINAMNSKLGDIESLSAFNPNTYYFAYNNELSKDIGLDMSGYGGEVDIEIYSIRESMPEEFYPIQDCRGIVVRKDAKIISAYISAGRHSAFNACSLKGHHFETVTSKSVNEWLAEVINADTQDERLSKLTPEQVLAEYFTALDTGDYNTAEYCLSKSFLLGNLTANMPNSELFVERIALQLTDSDFGAESSTDNVESAKLQNVELIEDKTQNMKTYRVYINLQLKQERTISSGEQFWDCVMIYESPQTGWKISGFGH